MKGHEIKKTSPYSGSIISFSGGFKAIIIFIIIYSNPSTCGGVAVLTRGQGLPWV